MIGIEINNNRVMKLEQDKERELIRVITGQENNIDRIDGISEGDIVMLINYYRFIKDNNIQCDFINPHGADSL